MESQTQLFVVTIFVVLLLVANLTGYDFSSKFEINVVYHYSLFLPLECNLWDGRR